MGVEVSGVLITLVFLFGAKDLVPLLVCYVVRYVRIERGLHWIGFPRDVPKG